MSKIKNIKTSKNDKVVDDLVVKEANDDASWGKEEKVIPKLSPTSIRLNARTIERAKFFAKIHKERGYQTWIKKIIEDRVNTEYELYKRLMKEAI